MLTEAIALALRHGTYVYDNKGILDKEKATFCFDDGDFTPNYSRKDFAASEAALLNRHIQGLQAMSPQDEHLRALGPQYVSTRLGSQNRKDALRNARKHTFLPVRPEWTDRDVEYQLTLLGTWLMREAQRNLPFGCVEAAIGFSQKSLKEREERLKVVFEYLLCSNWYAINEYRAKKFAEEKRHNPLEVLPRQYGQYPSSLVRPNCLGISAMLCGWCELAGVEYMYVNTVRDRSSTFAEMLVETIKYSLAWCQQHEITLSEGDLFAMQSQLDEFTNPHSASRFHHCVAVKMADDYWLMLDPYQELLLPISPINHRTGDSIEETYRLLCRMQNPLPGVVVQYESEDYEAIRGPADNRIQDSFLSAVDAKLYIRYFGNDPDTLFGAINLALKEGWFASFWEDSWQSCGISGSHLAFPEKKQGINHRTFYECMYGWVGASILNLASGYRFSSLEKLKAYYSANEGFAYRYRELFQTLPIILFVQQMQKYVYDEKSQYNHFVVEFGNPAFQLACNTLNHLSAWDEEFSAMVSPFDIAKFSGSQLIWHDALARWYNTDQSHQDAAWESYLISQLCKLEKYQWHFQTRQLLTYPDQEEPKDAENDERAEGSRDQEAA